MSLRLTPQERRTLATLALLLALSLLGYLLFR
jgi:hypothetical protein